MGKAVKSHASSSCIVPGMCPAHIHLLLQFLTGDISSEPLEEKGHLCTLINSQPELFGPVSMGTAAWLRLVFSVVNVDNKSSGEAAEQTPNLCPGGRTRPALFPSLEGQIWNWIPGSALWGCFQPHEGWHSHQTVEGTSREGCSEWTAAAEGSGH